MGWGGAWGTTTQFTGQPLSPSWKAALARPGLEYTFPVRTVGASGEQWELGSLPWLFKAEHLDWGLLWVRKRACRFLATFRNW